MKVKNKTYYIAHNNDDKFHYGVCEAGTNLDTGQPELETFDTEEKVRKRLLNFNIKPDKDYFI